MASSDRPSCPTCLNAGDVVNSGEGWRVSEPCPDCPKLAVPCISCGHTDPHSGAGIGVCLHPDCGCDGPCREEDRIVLTVENLPASVHTAAALVESLGRTPGLDPELADACRSFLRVTGRYSNDAHGRRARLLADQVRPVIRPRLECDCHLLACTICYPAHDERMRP